MQPSFLSRKVLIELGALFERRRVGDDERGIDLALLDTLQQLRQIVLDRRLGHPEGQAAIDRRTHRDLVEEAAIDADDRDDAEVAAAMDCLAQHVRPVGAHEGRDLDPVPTGVEARGRLGLGADRVDARIGAAALRQLHDAVVNILLHEIDRLGAGFARERKALGHGIDGENASGAEQEGAADRELPDRAAAPDRDRLAAFQVAEIRRHVAGREDVGQEKDLLVAQAVGNLDRTDIGVGHPQIFGLAAGVAAEKMRVTEQAGGRIAPELRGIFMIGVGALAARIEAVAAEEALAAGDRERHDDAVADLQLLVLGPDLDHLAHGLMAEDVALSSSRG